MAHDFGVKILILFGLSIIVACNNDTSPTYLISTQQTHQIQNGSYFQYTFTSMKLQEAQYNTSITQYSIQFNLQFVTTKPNTDLEYNILVFPQRNQSSQLLYQQYVRAAVQGLPGLMPEFPVNYSQPEIDCQSCYQSALYAQTPVACLRCTQPNIYANLTSQKWAQFQQWNSTVMTVVDNSLVVVNTGGDILLTMNYEIDVVYDQQYEALFILFFSVICSLIIILGILAVFITLRIRKVQQEIAICKEKNNHEKVE